MDARIKATDGFLFHLVKKLRPGLADRVAKSGRLDTIILGLGGQGTKHAGLMYDFGTSIVAGVAPGGAGTRVHEVIPVFDSVKDCLAEFPDVVAASVWRHYSTARDAALEAIEAGIPLVVLISEGLPLRDVRDVIVSARAHKTVLIGGNTPGLIFPPERIKIGMLPDVFFPEEVAPGRFGPRGGLADFSSLADSSSFSRDCFTARSTSRSNLRSNLTSTSFRFLEQRWPR